MAVTHLNTLLCTLLFLPVGLRAEASAHHAWQDVARGLFPDANAAFSIAAKTRPEDRGARLGQALTLLQLQPRTDARVRHAEALLTGLLDESTEDEIAANARYFLARLEQNHRSPANSSAAFAHYEKLLVEHPAHPLAGQALVKLALLSLYREQGAGELRAAFADFSRRASSLPVGDTASRRDLHLVLGEAALRFHLGDQAALEHFVAALNAGIRLRPVRADTLVRIGELAADLGQPALARRHYDLFIAEFPRDPRRLAVSEHLAALPPVAPSPPAP